MTFCVVVFSRDDDAVHAGGVSIRRLREIESLLGVAIDPAAGAGAAGGAIADVTMAFERQAIDLLRAFSEIEDDQLRREVLAIVRGVARLKQAQDA